MEIRTDFDFMQRKFTTKNAFDHYFIDVKQISKYIELDPNSKKQLNRYLNAIHVLKQANVFDIVKCAISGGKNLQGPPLRIWQSIPVITGETIYEATEVDRYYLQILSAYCQALQKYKNNIKNIMLRFVLTSRHSPISGFFSSRLDYIINRCDNLTSS